MSYSVFEIVKINIIQDYTMEGIYERAKKLGECKKYLLSSGTIYVETKINSEVWLASEQKFTDPNQSSFILTCNSQYVIISMDINDMNSAFFELENNRRPKKNSVAEQFSKFMPMFGNYKN